MSVFEVKVPAVGESVQEGEVYKWHKADGDMVELDDVLVELETDKATVEIVAESSGVLERVAQEGDTVKVGDLLGRLDASKKPSSSESKGSEKKAEKVEQAPVPPPPPAKQDKAEPSEKILSPAAQRLASDQGVDVNRISGTGRSGRVTKEDVIMAQDHQGRAGKVSAPAPAPVSVPVSTSGGRSTRREKMSRLRQKIAQRLVSAQHEAAMLTTFNEVDMSTIMALRSQYKDAFKEKHGVGLGFMSLFVKAAVEALKDFPQINAYIDGQELVFHDYFDVGVAVSTEKGLVVPVLRDCESMNFPQIEAQIVEYAKKARDGKLSIEDMSGGTFTISNGGVFGSLMSTPILNPPQSAILGMHKIQKRAVVIDDQVVIRPMMYLALSYDHRVVDGKEAVSFLVKIKEIVEQPARILLGV